MMKKILYIIAITFLLFANSAMAANTGRDINNKCRNNLKKLNAVTQKHMGSGLALAKWTTLKQALENFIDVEKDLDGKAIEGPTIDCQYFLISESNDDYQWLCNLHGVLDGEKTISFRYKEHQLQGKTAARYMNNSNYKEHVENLLHWTDYTPTPIELYKYHYNMNPITTTALTIILGIAIFFTLKTFFKF